MVVGGLRIARQISEVCISLEYKYHNLLHRLADYTTDINWKVLVTTDLYSGAPGAILSLLPGIQGAVQLLIS